MGQKWRVYGFSQRILEVCCIVAVSLQISCFEAEEFSVIPYIEFQDIQYVETDGIDSLILSFGFEDGDGDIGLSDDAQDISFPYHIYDVIIDSYDSVVYITRENLKFPLYAAPVVVGQNGNGELVYFYYPSEKVFFSDNDNRPPYSCEAYEIVGSDTVYISGNEFHFNFHIEFLAKRPGQTEYTVINFQEVFDSDDCTLGNYDARIPIFDVDGQQGVVTYAMLSQAFGLVFSDDSIKLRFYIYDRKLNKSNTEETNAFVFHDL